MGTFGRSWVALAAALLLAGPLLADAPPKAMGRGPDRHGPHPAPNERAPYDIALPASDYRPGPRTDMLIAGATILDGAGGRIVGDVLVRDGRIAAVGTNLPRPVGLMVIDGAGRWLTPGIVDIHTHYGTYLLPQSSAEDNASDVLEDSDPNVADTWIEHAVRPGDPAFSYALAGGVTTLQVLPGSGALFGGRSVILKPIPAVTVAAMRFPGAPQGLKMACGGAPAGSFGGRGRFPNSRQGEIAGIRRAFLEAQGYEKQWQRYLNGDDHRPPDRDLRLDTLVGAMHGTLPIHLHCYRADDIATWISVLDEFGVRLAAVHHATEAYKIAPLLAAHGVCAAVWPDWWGFKREAEDGIPENAAFVDAASGGCAIMHSDIPVLGSLLNIEAAKAAAAGRRAGLTITPEHAIMWITSNPAKAIGLGDRIGTIKPGMNADLVLWSADPFSVYAHVDRVYIDGALAFDHTVSRRPSDFELGRPQREER